MGWGGMGWGGMGWDRMGRDRVGGGVGWGWTVCPWNRNGVGWNGWKEIGGEKRTKWRRGDEEATHLVSGEEAGVWPTVAERHAEAARVIGG